MADPQAAFGSEPFWLRLAREMQAISQTGLHYATDVFDRQRYEQIRDLASDILQRQTDLPADTIAHLFAADRGYATPKVEVRGAVFDAQNRILLVREKMDQDRWTLPGGWADINLTPAENVVKEIREESGLETTVRKLAAVLDQARQNHPWILFSCTKLFFICDIAGGIAAPGLETSAIGWFAADALPDDLSRDRVLPAQLHRMFAHQADAALPADFD